MKGKESSDGIKMVENRRIIINFEELKISFNVDYCPDSREYIYHNKRMKDIRDVAKIHLREGPYKKEEFLESLVSVRVTHSKTGVDETLGMEGEHRKP